MSTPTASRTLRRTMPGSSHTAAAVSSHIGKPTAPYRAKYRDAGVSAPPASRASAGVDDLRSAADYYRRGASGKMTKDAYAQINAAFLEELLASRGDDAVERRGRAGQMRTKIAAHISDMETDWFCAASRAEALLGLHRYQEAAE